MYDDEIYNHILQIVKQYGSDSKGISKTEVTRIYTEKYGTSKTTIWNYIFDLIDLGKLELRKSGKVQQKLFLPIV